MYGHTSTLLRGTTLSEHTCLRTACMKIVRTKTFLCQSDTYGSVPRAYSAKRYRTNPYQSPVSNRKKDAVPRVYLHLFRGGRYEPKQAKRLRSTQLYPGSALRGQMSYHNPKLTKQNKNTPKAELKQETERTHSISHQNAWGSTSLDSTIAPTNSTLEVHSLMWCLFPPHLWQICLGHCWMKWLLSPQTKHLLSFRARRPPRMMRVLLGDARSLMLLRCSVPGTVCLPPCDSPPSPVARRGRCCPLHYLGHGHRQRLQLRAEVADCRVRTTLTLPCYLLSFFSEPWGLTG